MTYDEKLAERTRRVIPAIHDIVEKKMFGGLAFLLEGKMFVGINDKDLMVRVGPDARCSHQAALAGQWVNHYGPAKMLAANLDDAKRADFKRAMIEWHETFPSTLGYDQPRQYVITRAIRR